MPAIKGQRADRLTSVMKISIVLLLPIVFIFLDYSQTRTAVDPSLIGKWSVFWGNGVYLFVTGGITVVKSLLQKNLSPKCLVPGVAKTCISLPGLVSIITPQWRLLSALVGCCCWCLLTFRYAGRKDGSIDELIRQLCASIQCLSMMLYLCFYFFYQPSTIVN